jgi:acyl-CoA thioesterase-1
MVEQRHRRYPPRVFCHSILCAAFPLPCCHSQGTTPVTSSLIFFFGSGLAFFLGVALVLTALLLTTAERKPRLRRLARLAAAVGLVFVVLSAVPLPWWVLASLVILLIGWGIAELFLAKRQRWRLLVRATVGFGWLAVAAMELPHQFVPPIGATGRPPLWIVGDSVTAGVGDKKTVLWPRLLADAHGITVHDRSQMGATVSTALRKLEKEPLGEGIILLEIGGNDLLGPTKLADFEEQLDQLFAHVCGPGRTVVMFELPLPPLCNGWGVVQRRLAAKHGVLLIPKRVFVTVLTAGEATLDSIHLSQSGHEAMAEAVWQLLESVYRE